MFCVVFVLFLFFGGGGGGGFWSFGFMGIERVVWLGRRYALNGNLQCMHACMPDCLCIVIVINIYNPPR